MPSTTPRGYPYSLPTDPTDIPGAIQALAEAIDPDTQAVADSVAPRPAFRFSGTEPILVPTNTSLPVPTFLTFTDVDFSVGGAAPSMGPLTRVVPQLPGFYWVDAQLVYPQDGSFSMDLVSLSVQNATATLTRTSMHEEPPVSDGEVILSVQTGVFCNGTTDYVEVVCTTRRTLPAIGNMRLRSRHIALTRMTTS